MASLTFVLFVLTDVVYSRTESNRGHKVGQCSESLPLKKQQCVTVSVGLAT